MKLILASSSPRRVMLLGQIGLSFDTAKPAVDEASYPAEEPVRYVERIAREKARNVLVDDAVVIAGDTAVVFEGRVMGKPSHPEEARSMLRRLQGTSHEVFTGVAVAAFVHGEPVVRSLVDGAEVEMLTMTETEIYDYVATGEPLDKAGAYALQGLGGRFVSSVRGHPSTVIGLPVHFVTRLIEAVGGDIARFMSVSPG